MPECSVNFLAFHLLWGDICQSLAVKLLSLRDTAGLLVGPLFPSLMTLLPHSRLPQGQKHPLIICSLCSHPCRCSMLEEAELMQRWQECSTRGSWAPARISGALWKTACGAVVLTIPERGGGRGLGVEAAGTVDQALTPRTGELARSPAHSRTRLRDAAQSSEASFTRPISDGSLRHCALTASPPRGAAKSELCAHPL